VGIKGDIIETRGSAENRHHNTDFGHKTPANTTCGNSLTISNLTAGRFVQNLLTNMADFATWQPIP